MTYYYALQTPLLFLRITKVSCSKCAFVFSPRITFFFFYFSAFDFSDLSLFDDNDRHPIFQKNRSEKSLDDFAKNRPLKYPVSTRHT